MTDRKELINDLERCIESEEKACPSVCPFYKECCLLNDFHPFIPIMREALKLLKEQEQTAESTPWICHLYRCGDKRFECSWCHGTSWKASDYCPDCGTRMAEEVDMDD